VKKVLLIVPLSTLNWGEKNAGGVDSVCQILVEYLETKSQTNYHFTIVGLDPNSLNKYTGEVVKLNEHVDFIWLPCSGKKLNFKIPGFFWLYLHIKKICQQIDPDLIHVHLWSLLFGVKHKAKTLITIHSYKTIGRHRRVFFNNLIYEKIIPFFIRNKGDFKVVVGATLQQALKHHGFTSQVIYNPIDSLYFQHACEHKYLGNAPIKFITCALIHPKKNFEQAINFIHLMHQHGYKCSLDIIGPIANSDYYNQLKHMISSLAVAESIRFLGKKKKHEMAQLYQQADCGIFTSLEETFGLAPLEMLASGLPLLSNPVGILAECKTVFEAIDVRFFGPDLQLDDISVWLKQYHSDTAVSQVKALFNIERFYQQHELIYNQLLSE